jgi:hypothetical protein
MKIRNPFKDYLLRWKDDATNSEKFICSVVCAAFGYFLISLIKQFI